MSKLIEQLKRHEGLRLKPYKCTAGKLTIGYGRNIEDNGITEQEASELLKNDIETCRAELSKFDWYYSLDSVRQDCLENMCFNIGTPALLKFIKMINAIKLRDYEQAAKEMLNSKWAQQVGNRAVELAEQMRTGAYSEV